MFPWEKWLNACAVTLSQVVPAEEGGGDSGGPSGPWATQTQPGAQGQAGRDPRRSHGGGHGPPRSRRQASSDAVAGPEDAGQCSGRVGRCLSRGSLGSSRQTRTSGRPSSDLCPHLSDGLIRQPQVWNASRACLVQSWPEPRDRCVCRGSNWQQSQRSCLRESGGLPRGEGSGTGPWWMSRSLPRRQEKGGELFRQQMWPGACGTGVQIGLWSVVCKGALNAWSLLCGDQEPTVEF